MSSGSPYWDRYFRDLRDGGIDLDWRGRWTEPFLPLLRSARARRVLELGCGTGNDAARLRITDETTIGVYERAWFYNVDAEPGLLDTCLTLLLYMPDGRLESAEIGRDD